MHVVVSAMPSPTLVQLRILLAIVDEGSLTDAAAALDVAQSTVSHALAQLENHLGERLVKRGRAGARPTALGERVAQHARVMLRLNAALLEEANRARGALQGTLRVASFRSVATHVLPDVIAAFRQRHPAARVELQSLEGEERGIERAILEGRADVGILTPPAHDRLDVREFATDDWVAIFPSGGAPSAEQASWPDLLALPFLLCNETGAPTVRDYWHRHEQTFQHVAQVEDDSVILSMVAHEFGVSILPRLAAEPLPDGVQIRQLPEPLKRKIAVVALPALSHTPLVKAFVQSLIDPVVLHSCQAVSGGFLQVGVRT